MKTNVSESLLSSITSIHFIPNGIVLCITQYGSTVYIGIAMVDSIENHI